MQKLESSQLQSALESLIFVSERPVMPKALIASLEGYEHDVQEVEEALHAIQLRLEEQASGLQLVLVSGGYQFRTKKQNAAFLQMQVKNRPFRLTQASLEVLSFVAYQQPINKAEIDKLRGVESGHLLRALMDRGLIAFKGKSDLPGKPMLYGTTQKFLEIFGLRSIKELPTMADIEQLIPQGLGDEADEEKETLAEVSGHMAEGIKNSYSESEEELLSIVDEIQAIETTTTFFQQEKEAQAKARDEQKAAEISQAIENFANGTGEEVSNRDRRWLERYQAAQNPVSEIVSTEEPTPESEPKL